MSTEAKKVDLVVTRVFDAPVELVWQAWTEPKHVMRWWGPNFFTCPTCAMDFRVGGTALVCMRAPKEFGRHLCQGLSKFPSSRACCRTFDIAHCSITWAQSQLNWKAPVSLMLLG